MKMIIFIVSASWIVIPLWAQQQVVTDPPEVRGPFTLVATHDSATGHNAFAYNGNTVPPMIRVLPGGVIKLHYVNSLPIQSDEMCATGRCTNMTNLHFHGLHVSPQNPQDDVLTMMAMPGQALDYKVEVPSYAAPGLFGITRTRTEKALVRISTVCREQSLLRASISIIRKSEICVSVS